MRQMKCRYPIIVTATVRGGDPCSVISCSHNFFCHKGDSSKLRIVLFSKIARVHLTYYHDFRVLFHRLAKQDPSESHVDSATKKNKVMVHIPGFMFKLGRLSLNVYCQGQATQAVF